MGSPGAALQRSGEAPVHGYGPDSKSVKTSTLGCLLSVWHCRSCRVSSFQVLLRMIEIIYKALSKLEF